ncbi:urease accessory protein UreD, partial [Staphylococcus aureus]|uniref:urease accessory protein UreD n=1 Tax=Staphylococcus aureus TaxID=1280 RepID=UPI001642935D
STIPTFYILNLPPPYLHAHPYPINLNLQHNPKLTFTSQPPTKIYNTPSNHLQHYQTFNFKHNPYLQYLPHPIIPYQNPKFYQHNTFNLNNSTSL